MQIYQSIVELTVKNVGLSLAFYQHMLGFKKLAEDRAGDQIYWALLDLNGFQLSLKEEAKQKDESPFLVDQPRGGSMLLCFHVKDINATYNTVAAKCKTLNHPHLTPCGATDFSMKDMDGYILTFQELGKHPA
ncbi:MAG: VOC family protein [Saprospiraceae bacterium]|nr:VOC family protein [Saprospiraceae bacterium]